MALGLEEHTSSLFGPVVRVALPSEEDLCGNFALVLSHLKRDSVVHTQTQSPGRSERVPHPTYSVVFCRRLGSFAKSKVAEHAPCSITLIAAAAINGMEDYLKDFVLLCKYW